MVCESETVVIKQVALRRGTSGARVEMRDPTEVRCIVTNNSGAMTWETSRL